MAWFWKRWTRERRRNTFRNLLRKPINFESNHARLVRFVVHANRSDSYRVSFETLIIGVVPIRIDCLTAHIHTAFLWIIQYTGRLIEFHPFLLLSSLFAPCPYITGGVLLERLLLINDLPECFNVFNAGRVIFAFFFLFFFFFFFEREREERANRGERVVYIFRKIIYS